eukprot:9403251-Alexandrium_andersonii.AAC.1
MRCTANTLPTWRAAHTRAPLLGRAMHFKGTGRDLARLLLSHTHTHTPAQTAGRSEFAQTEHACFTPQARRS